VLLDGLAGRAQKCQEKVNRLRQSRRRVSGTGGDDGGGGGSIKVSYPDCYEDVTGIHDIRLELGRRNHRVHQTRQTTSTTINTIGNNDGLESAIPKARSKSNAAILSVLQRDATVTTSNPEYIPTAVHDATPSDVWLDRASAFEEKKTARLAVRLDSVPSLVVSNSVSNPFTSAATTTTVEEDEAQYYQTGLRRIQQQQRSSSGSTESGSNRYNNPKSIISETVHRDDSTIATNYSVLSHATASHRRRQRIQSTRRNRTIGNENGEEEEEEELGDAASSSTNGRYPTTFGGARQQAMTGSLPYLCEVLHDTYGLGTVPNDAEGGNVFKGVEDVCDLTIYGTGRMAYYREPNSPTTATGGGSGDASVKPTRMVNQRHGTGTQVDKTGTKLFNALSAGTARSSSSCDGGSPMEPSSSSSSSLSSKRNPTSYVPDVLAKDAGLFQLPENLPL